ncbi:Acetoacetate metabolism regulatory protein AtoC [Chlamydiales bacterium SCGC AG-110-P3]|nr:Acetoacetate metabolism regulatory protein AtoC [Chlamydiales bacterium SCGC AG-110-P3]
MTPKILIADDDVTICETLEALFCDKGYVVETAHDGSSAVTKLKKAKSDACLLDVQLPDADGIELLETLKVASPETVFLIITAYGSVSQSVDAMKQGAIDYILKPFNIDEITLRVERALKNRSLVDQVDYLAEKVYGEWDADYIVSTNSAMKKVHDSLQRIAKSNSTTVFINGETGTGKEVIARRIHGLSPRQNRPFVDVNATALTAELLESELFGHEAGSFTGATKTKKGLFEVASGGTLFLDEIGDMDVILQSKLLRALEERKVRRVGGTESIDVDIRLITATNQDLQRLVSEGKFREDLYYRLNVVPLNLPPLRERSEDLRQFVDHFLGKFCVEFGRSQVKVSTEAMQKLTEYSWPGNIRELKNVIERAVLLEVDGEVLEADHLLLAGDRSFGLLETASGASEGAVIGDTIPLETVERQHITGVLRSTGGNKNQAAQILGIDRTTLYNKIKKYQIS